VNTPITVPRHSAGFLSSSPKKILIAGDWVAAGNGVFESRDPATGALLAEIGCASEVDVDQAVRSARETLTGRWAQCTPGARGKLLWRLADLIDEHADRALPAFGHLLQRRPESPFQTDAASYAATRHNSQFQPKILGRDWRKQSLAIRMRAGATAHSSPPHALC